MHLFGIGVADFASGAGRARDRTVVQHGGKGDAAIVGIRRSGAAWHARAHRRRTNGYDPILPVPHKWCFVEKILLLAFLTIFEDSRD